MSRPIELIGAIRKRDGAGVMRPDAIEDDSTTGCDSRGGADPAQDPFFIYCACAPPSHQAADVIAR
jgi:hypothetical protein